MSQKKVYSIINQKGGVGKTTTTINLGTAMAACDAKVLLIDMDPQGNLSTGLGVSPSKRQFGCYNILTSWLSMSSSKSPISAARPLPKPFFIYLPLPKLCKLPFLSF